MLIANKPQIVAVNPAHIMPGEKMLPDPEKPEKTHTVKSVTVYSETAGIFDRKACAPGYTHIDGGCYDNRVDVYVKRSL